MANRMNNFFNDDDKKIFRRKLSNKNAEFIDPLEISAFRIKRMQ